MPVQVGVNTSFGAKMESAWGTGVTPDRFWEIRSEEVELQKQLIPSEGLRRGRRNLNRSDTYAQYNKGAVGDVVFEWMNKSMAWWLKPILGALAAPVEAPAGVYTHVGSIATLTGASFSMQLVKDTMPFTYYGCKVGSWELAAELDGLLMATVGVQAKTEIATRVVTDGATTNADATLTSATAVFHANDVGKPISGTGIPAASTILSVTDASTIEMSANATATATGVTVTIGPPAAAESYPTELRPFSFVHGALSVAGVPTDITAFNLAGDNNLPERWFFGAVNKEPLDQGRTIEGSFQTEYEDNVIYDRFVNGVEAAITLEFSTAEQGIYVAGTTPYSMTISLPSVRYDGETPNTEGPEIITQNTPFTVLNDDATITIVNGDSVA